MIRAILVAAAIVALAAIGGCKQRSDRADGQAALAAMRGFTDKMCACKDRACADEVQGEMARWAQDMARHGDRAPRLDEAVVKSMSEVSKQYADCMTAAAGDGVAATALADPPANAPFQIDPQLLLVRQRAAKHAKKLVMSELEISYARANGTLDPQYGKLEVSFAVPPAPPADDPNRPIGAPLPPPPSGQQDMDCPAWTFEHGHWQQRETLCMGPMLAPAHCTIAQVWARAIADEAPPGALATISLMAREPQQWQFTISDPPRNIDFRKAYADDCEPVLEKPAK